MDKWKIDVAVLLIFFNRPKQFKQVFDEVKKAKPRVLFLYQDGARKNNDKDIDGIMACREIASDITWECEVYQMYQKQNYGCDPSEFIAQKWAFGIVDKCIVLEDDDVPSQDFFYFCKQMLDRYENDERINIISGQNILGEFPVKNADYFFSKICAIWGWASWRRVIEKWDPDYHFFDDQDVRRLLNQKNRGNQHYNMTIKSAMEHRKTGIEHYESILSTSMYYNDRINIVPCKNYITNIGIAEESTHSTSDINNLPRGIRSVFNMERIDEGKRNFIGPLKIDETVEYRKKVCRKMAWGYPLVQFWRNIESVILVTVHQGVGETVKKIKKRF